MIVSADVATLLTRCCDIELMFCVLMSMLRRCRDIGIAMSWIESGVVTLKIFYDNSEF